MIDFKKPNSTQDYILIEQLADIIWRDHYTNMVGKPQVDYMLSEIQSAKAIKIQVEAGLDYYILNDAELPVGYIAIKKELETLFLSKIYILKEYRGKNLGKTALNFVEKEAKTYHLKAIRLTVSINNTSAIAVYKKLGFEISKPIKIDIGNGFFMDDYEMLKSL